MSQITYTIDPAHSTAGFKVRHLMVAWVKGEFSGVAGTVVYDAEKPSDSKVEATVDVNTLHTRDEQRDTHLKSADFFDAAKYPTITFVSTKLQKVAEGEWKVTGDLAIHGVTRQVVLEVEGPAAEVKDPWGNTRTGVSATTQINRTDFGLVWNAALETGGVLVGEEVQISLELELVKK
uniref:YceI family protein n=1 Tax=Solibacter usitatus (strain Ellin6076) TaxID=234267 RepID=Q01WI0_SOLUE